MNKTYSLRRFTLVEILVVTGIVAVLAGLILPAVIGGIQNGRITQAKSDISSILMALKGVEGTYGKMVKTDSTGAYKFNGKSPKTDTNNNKVIILGQTDCVDAYNAFIAELTVPGNTGLTARNINARKIKFLEPKPSFAPDKSYDDAANIPHLWRDPWGNPYVILINTAGEDNITVPAHSKKIAAKAAAYSFGPNGQDDGGGNANTCSNTAHKLHDDITSWD